jgi:serine/threonine-protein kinase RsbW
MKGRVVIQSDPQNMGVVDEIMVSLATELSLSEQQHFNIHLALGESIQNAILHGNASDPSKKVVIDYELYQGQLFFCISDQGTGFDVQEVADPTASENLEKEGGRGVLFLKQITKHFHYCNEARAVKFTIDLR